jgi:hypothetical protein
MTLKAKQANNRQASQIEGVVVKGYQVASGRSKTSPYPAGSITLQMPFFKREGLDLSGYFAATINIDISPRRYSFVEADYRFDKVTWTAGVCEDFLLDKCQIIHKTLRYPGYIYFPHPATKPDHYHSPSIIEVISVYIRDLKYADKIVITINPQHFKQFQN